MQIAEKRIEVRSSHCKKVRPLSAVSKSDLRGIRTAQNVFVMLTLQLSHALFVDIALADLDGLDVLERINELGRTDEIIPNRAVFL